MPKDMKGRSDPPPRREVTCMRTKTSSPCEIQSRIRVLFEEGRISTSSRVGNRKITECILCLECELQSYTQSKQTLLRSPFSHTFSLRAMVVRHTNLDHSNHPHTNPPHTNPQFVSSLLARVLTCVDDPLKNNFGGRTCINAMKRSTRSISDASGYEFTPPNLRSAVNYEVCHSYKGLIPMRRSDDHW